jgi:hypothetical protein
MKMYADFNNLELSKDIIDLYISFHILKNKFIQFFSCITFSLLFMIFPLFSDAGGGAVYSELNPTLRLDDR